MPKLRDEKKVQQIFQAALRQVLNTGYAGLKMSIVAQEAELATGTIYTYFDSKNHLINELFRELKRGKMEAVMRNYDPSGPFYEEFERLWKNFLKAGIEQPERNLFISQYQWSDYLDEISRSVSKAAYQPLYDLLRQAQLAKIVKDIPVEVMAAHLVGGANEVAKLYFGQPVESAQAIIDQCFEMAWRSIRK